MARKHDFGIWVLVIFVAHRIYLMATQVNQLDCVTNIIEKPHSKYGPCVNGVRTYFDWNATATPYTVSCGDFVSDAMTSLNCIDGDIKAKDRNKLIAHLVVLVVNVAVFFLPVPPIVYRFVTAFMAFITINGKLFGTPMLLFASVTISLFGDVLLGTLLNLADRFGGEDVVMQRAKSGRFVRRGR